LSAITWAGFDNFYYFFAYEETRDAFNIPHDLKILKEFFNVENGNYSHKNEFWKYHHITSLISDNAEQKLTSIKIQDQINYIKSTYNEHSQIYQSSKINSDIPLN